MFKNSLSLARKYGNKAAAGVALTLGSAMAFAQDTGNPIVTILDSISMAGVAAAIAALALIIVAIALTMKGPDVAKRIIRKV